MTIPTDLVDQLGEVLGATDRWRMSRVGGHAYASTFPMVVVTVELDGSLRELLVKCSAGLSHDAFGHRGGVRREAEAYRNLLQRCPLSLPSYYGCHLDDERGEACLVIEFLPEAHRLHASVDPAAMPAAARWIGAFHRWAEQLDDLGLWPYDTPYYLGWFQRTRQYVTAAFGRSPWLDHLCHRVSRDGLELFAAVGTAIHGEYYPKNILVSSALVYPVDWESAAIAPGQVDLASLVQGWPIGVIEACQAAYVDARWDGRAPAGHERLTAEADLYLLARWLGDQPAWTADEQGRQRVGLLKAGAAQLGLI